MTWRCPNCTLENTVESLVCAACAHSRTLGSNNVTTADDVNKRKIGSPAAATESEANESKRQRATEEIHEEIEEEDEEEYEDEEDGSEYEGGLSSDDDGFDLLMSDDMASSSSSSAAAAAAAQTLSRLDGTPCPGYIPAIGCTNEALPKNLFCQRCLARMRERPPKHPEHVGTPAGERCLARCAAVAFCCSQDGGLGLDLAGLLKGQIWKEFFLDPEHDVLTWAGLLQKEIALVPLALENEHLVKRLLVRHHPRDVIEALTVHRRLSDRHGDTSVESWLDIWPARDRLRWGLLGRRDDYARVFEEMIDSITARLVSLRDLPESLRVCTIPAVVVLVCPIVDADGSHLLGRSFDAALLDVALLVGDVILSCTPDGLVSCLSLDQALKRFYIEVIWNATRGGGRRSLCQPRVVLEELPIFLDNWNRRAVGTEDGQMTGCQLVQACMNLLQVGNMPTKQCFAERPLLYCNFGGGVQSLPVCQAKSIEHARYLERIVLDHLTETIHRTGDGPPTNTVESLKLPGARQFVDLGVGFELELAHRAFLLQERATHGDATPPGLFSPSILDENSLRLFRSARRDELSGICARYMTKENALQRELGLESSEGLTASGFPLSCWTGDLLERKSHPVGEMTWVCSSCTLENKAGAYICAACEKPPRATFRT